MAACASQLVIDFTQSFLRDAAFEQNRQLFGHDSSVNQQQD
jgi:hypothetical protein